MKLKILAIGDSTNNIHLMKKYGKNFDIHIIDFPKKGVDKLTTSEDKIEYFDSLLISKQVKKINSIKHNFDLCLATPWAGARIAYLAGINYIMYFVGNDITTPPFAKDNKKYNYIEKYFYKKILDKAIACIGPQHEYFIPLKKYRKDAIRLDRAYVDIEYYNEKISPIELKKNKFTFLSAQRFGTEKGIEKIWEAIKICKTDFEILQVKWFIEESSHTVEGIDQLGQVNKKLVDEIPDKVKFIPLIKNKELGRYFVSVDAIMGQMRSGAQGAIERDAAYCKIPILCFTDPNQPIIMDGKKITPPFLPQSNTPQEIAKIIDNIVESKQFRDDLAEKEYEYIKKLCDPELVSKDWEKVFNSVLQKNDKINRNLSILEKLIYRIIFRLEKKYIKKFKEKNIQVYGKKEYEQLIKE